MMKSTLWSIFPNAAADVILERWEIMNAYSGCMGGDPGISVILDAYAKGIRKFDIHKAYAVCRQTATGTGATTNRPDNDFYLENGYVPNQVSWTLDDSYYHWCVGRLAEYLGNNDDAKLFSARARNYRNIYDREVGFMRARDRSGRRLEWLGETAFGQGCTESDPLQQTWFVPHDIYGLIDLMGKRSVRRHTGRHVRTNAQHFRMESVL
jgi:putative alpha-1,2-mannosidase